MTLLNGESLTRTDVTIDSTATPAVGQVVAATQVGGGTATGFGLMTAAIMDGVPKVAKPLGDGRAGLLDWQNDDTTGYLMHLRAGPNSGANNAVVGIGTDFGAASGLLLSHKNSGSGLRLISHPSSGFGAYLSSYAANSGMLLDTYAGSDGIKVRAVTGQGYADGQSTSGSTTFTSATAAFTAGDIGQSIIQLTSRGSGDLTGCIPSGATITAVTNATTVTLSAPATATSSGGVMFRVSGRVPSTGLTLFHTYDIDGTTELVAFRRASSLIGTALTVTPVSGDTTRVPLAVKSAATSAIDALQVQESGGAAHVRVTKATSSVAASLVVGKSALALGATDGFIYAPTVAGTPTGTPTTQTGTVPLLVDTTASKLWAYLGGVWKSVTFA